MKEFKELLQRYHISPLQYQDGTELNESDYFNLAEMLLKYYYSRNIMNCTKIPKISDNLRKKVTSHCQRSLLGFELEDLMDILMEQNGGMVI